VLRLVPEGHREAALALGAPRWRLMWSVVLPAAAPGILTGIMLGIARAAGETAPLIFTALGGGNIPTSTDIFQPIAAIPKLIFDNTIMTQTPASLQLAWGAALVLVSVILLLSLGARLVSWRAGGSQRP
jgi:phosphate transport system permease protein